MKRLVLLLIMFPLAVAAAPPATTVGGRETLRSAGFLSGHPDLRWRRQGLFAYEAGEFEEALVYFKRSARYADKPSQAMVAEMLWEGLGVERNRALAYAWMDLAAERAYLPFLAKRESYWRGLDEAQRRQVFEVGPAVYAKYGDAVAKPRLETVFRHASYKITGSRVGFVGALEILVPGPGGRMRSIEGNSFYHDKFWKPEQYWEWQAEIWRDPPSWRGTVKVREPETLGRGSRVRDEGD